MRGSSRPGVASGPSSTTFQQAVSIPFGTYRNARRTGGFAEAASAGDIASSQGSAKAAPAPRKKVRRGKNFRLKGMGIERQGAEAKPFYYGFRSLAITPRSLSRLSIGGTGTHRL